MSNSRRLFTGRARLARPSLCLLVVAAVWALGAPLASAAGPAVPKPTATNPASSEALPAAATAPLVSGEAEPSGVITSVLKPPPFGPETKVPAIPRDATQHPEYEIVIYGQAECKGAPIGQGRADTFEGSGIAVIVPGDALTLVSAKQVDPANPSAPSDCSASLGYWEGNVPRAGGGSGGPAAGGDTPSQSVGPGVTTGKPAPPHIHTNPSGTANDNTPSVVGSAPGAGSVSIFASADCSGTPVAKGSAAQLAAGFSVSVADNTTNTFSAFSTGGQRSNCSSPVPYVEDSTAPRTRVTMGPGVKTRKRKVAFRFADVTEDPPGTRFFCKVDKAKWKPCSSPLRLKRLRLSRYVVRFRAVDLAGNAEKIGAKRIFTVIPGS
jgi:hypothetical protein